MLRLVKYMMVILGCCLASTPYTWGQDVGETPEDRYLQSQIEEKRFDRERWSKLIQGIDFSEKTGRQVQPEPNSSNRDLPDITPNWRAGTGTAIARFLLIVLGAVVIALLVRAMLGYSQVKDKKITPRTQDGINIKKIEENIHQADLDDYIDQAKAEGNFNLAVRLYYLAILKELSIGKHIKWKVDKTNSEYLLEMRNHQDFQSFRDLTRIFERTWYGDRVLNAGTFGQFEPSYRQFIDRISSPKTAPAS